MRKSAGIITIFICMLIFVTTNVFAGDSENKKSEMPNSNMTNDNKVFLENVKKSIDKTIKLCEQISQSVIEKTLLDYGIVEEKSSYSDKISKGEFVKAVLKVMGVTDEFAEYWNKYVTMEYNSSITAFSKRYKKGITEYKEEKGLIAYISMINSFEIISRGDFKDAENSYPNDDIVLEECLTVINKCLDKEVSEDIISEAEKDGLIKNTDKIMSKNNKTLNYEDFCVLLYRMLEMEMGYYFRYYGDYAWDYCLYDKTETDWEGDRYMDYLNFVKNQDIIFDGSDFGYVIIGKYDGWDKMFK